LDFAAGDSCFYIGLGNTKTNTPTFEPYQCCPKPQSHASEKEKPGKTANKEAKNSEPKINSKPDNNKKRDKKNKKDNNGKASWWW